ncbi:hypothetical protein BOO86_13030 [Mycobacterium sp. CBMA 234]|uniref:LuxR C-terminal-related transcriptional regulator n=1 Tax=Mycolicibacterium sp. CBMA 234 TaxID=1918495 RepID=UPI0012DF2D7E|nr:LuxR C-terminal-related transcriptional regulator [Mycolicibacterium sp. CBMA 234]MUL65395.1 hypothetical protein [Mycolicibacterium sp. CBMA 234]
MTTIGLPVPLTNFVGRGVELREVQGLLGERRLVSLIGPGGVGKTRLAVQLAAIMAADFGDGIWFVELAPLTAPDSVVLAVTRALGLPDQPGRSAIDTIERFIAGRRVLVVLDNCEHLLDGCGAVIATLLGACASLTVLTTSREPIGVSGESMWRVEPLPVADEAVELFCDRARLASPAFDVSGDRAGAVAEICQQLDGMPLAIELAAARVRVLSVTEIRDGVHDCFSLLAGRSRTSVRRHQTLSACMDWSHALLTEPEQVTFRRLGVFVGGFDLAAADAVDRTDGTSGLETLDRLALLVDKSLVCAETSSGRTRYHLLETMRQYALDKLAQSGEADGIRIRHRDHYLALARQLDESAHAADERFIGQVEIDIDNLRAAFDWSRHNSEAGVALEIASSLEPFWLKRGRHRDGLTWFDAILDEDALGRDEVPPATWAAAVATRSAVARWISAPGSLRQAEHALSIARRLDDPALTARVLAACGNLSIYRLEQAEPYFAEAIDVAQASGDWWRRCQIRAFQGYLYNAIGDPTTARAASEDGRDIAAAHGDGFYFRACSIWLGIALMVQGHLTETAALQSITAEAGAHGEMALYALGLLIYGQSLAYQGKAVEAHDVTESAFAAVATMGGYYEDAIYTLQATTALAAGDPIAARDAAEAAWRCTVPERKAFIRGLNPMAEALLACGNLDAAHQWADDTAATTSGWQRAVALTGRARVAIARGDHHDAERDAHDALTVASGVGAYLRVFDAVECLAEVAAAADRHRDAARLLGAADAIRSRHSEGRFRIYQDGHQMLTSSCQDALGSSAFHEAWGEGAALSTAETIAYVKRGRGERRRPSTGWGALTPMERNVIELASEGLSNRAIAERLFISPRTVQTHLAHVYAKLGIASRVQLAQEASRHR